MYLIRRLDTCSNKLSLLAKPGTVPFFKFTIIQILHWNLVWFDWTVEKTEVKHKIYSDNWPNNNGRILVVKAWILFSVPIQDCTVHHLLHVYHNPESALILDNKISGRKDKKIPCFCNYQSNWIDFNCFHHNIFPQHCYLRTATGLAILLALTEIHYFFDFNYTIRAKCFNFQSKVTGGGGGGGVQNVKGTKFCQQLYHWVC